MLSVVQSNYSIETARDACRFRDFSEKTCCLRSNWNQHQYSRCPFRFYVFYSV